MKENKIIVDVDGNWKAFIHYLFPKFVRYFFKGLYESADWSRGYEPLEQELWNFLEKVQKGSKKVDKLYKIWLKDGREQWILIHFEVQHDANSDINLRMLEYFMHLHLKHHAPIASFVLFTGKTKPPNAGLIELKVEQTKLTYEYPFFHIYAQSEEQLLADKNVISLAFLAHKAMLDTTQSDEKRLEWKKKIVLWSEKLGEDFEKILNFVVGILPLKGDYATNFITFLKTDLKMGKIKEPRFPASRETLDIIFLVQHDMTFDEYEKRLIADLRAKVLKEESERVKTATEQAEAEIVRAEAEKLREFEHSVMKLRYRQNMEVEEIADFFETDLPKIEAILKKYDAEKERFMKKK